MNNLCFFTKYNPYTQTHRIPYNFNPLH